MKMNDLKLLSERFEVAFNNIQDSMERLVNVYHKGFTDLVRVCASRHQIIKEYQDDLIQFAKLRNAIVHEKVELGYYIAEPHEDVVQRIEKIAKILSKPNYVLTIASKNVIHYQYNDPITKVIKEMKDHSHSQFPVYHNGKCIGLLKSRTIVKWLADHLTDPSFSLDQIMVKDVFIFEKDHQIIFVPKTYSIFDIEDAFEQAHSNKQDIEMAIVTENGKPGEIPLGIVTAWDLIEIDYTAD